MSFAERVRREQAKRNMFLVRGNDSQGRQAWYFVLIAPGKTAAFQKAVTGQLELTKYGKIICSGFGKDPPQDVRERMKTEYGFNSE
jgi:hypothetical protein